MGIADMLDELEIKEPLPSYSPTLYRITGGKGEAVALAQLIYKCAKSNWGTVRMSSTDWANELGITRNEFENLNDCINLLELGTAVKCQIGTIKKIAYTLNEQAIKEALKNPHVEYSICKKQRINTLNSTYQHAQNNVSTRRKQRINTHKTAHIKDIKTIKSKEDVKEAFTETSSVVPSLFKSELMQQALEAGIENNSAAKPKTKKLKAELSQIDAEIRDKVKYIANNFKLWHDKNKEIVYLHKDSDFVQLTKLFKQLCKKEGYTTDQVIADLNLIVSKFDKLPHFYQSNFNLTYIATNYQKLLLEIKNPKPAPVAKPNYNEPVPYVHKRLPQYYDGYTLPLGITAMQFEQLAELVMREKIMEGLIDENLRLSGFCQMYRIELHKITEEQLTQLMKDYEII